MSVAERRGMRELSTSTGRVRMLPAAPMIAPTRQYVFPVAVPGEEEALNRGSVFVEATPAAGATFLAQCAIGFTGDSVANGLWTSPAAGEVIVVAGGYAYALHLQRPEKTALLPMRPVVELVDDSSRRLVLVGYHDVFVLQENGETWRSERLSWEGVTISSLAGDVLRGSGWDMMADEEVPFSLDLGTRELAGGGYRQG